MCATKDPVDWDDSHTLLSTLCQSGYLMHAMLGVGCGGKWRKPLDIGKVGCGRCVQQWAHFANILLWNVKDGTNLSNLES